jgi:aminoglycoside 3-N-acetyltransferase
MGERKSIERAGERPATIDSLRSELLALGLEPGMTVLVHSSLSALGWVSGGPVAVILALEMVLGDEGTLVMPTHSTDLSDPAHWQNPPVPQTWWEVIRETMPAYDPDLTHTRGMGRIPETFRKQRGVIRSSHPLDSFAARGPAANFICADHSLDYSLGEGSPLARLYESKGWVLLLGVGHENNTSLHLAEYRAEFASKKVVINGAPILVEGNRQWVKIQDIDLNSDDFATIGADYETETGQVVRGRVAQGEALLMPQKTLVDYGVQWMEKNRQ